MSRSNEFFASSASGSGTPSHARSLHPKELLDLGAKRHQHSDSSVKARSRLSVDDIDEQIRAYFAQDLT